MLNARKAHAVVVAAALTLGACASTTTTSSAPAPAPTAPTTTTTTPVLSHCHARGSGLYALPDPVCTPGALNRDVTQASIGKTICVPGWTSTVRPPPSKTGPEKRVSMKEYGVGPASAYEYDHLVPLELGGAPNDPRNLWPELNTPGVGPNTFVHNPKDKLETVLRKLVCADHLSLAAAQHAIVTDWASADRQYVKP